MSELREKFEKTCLPIFCGYELTFQEEHDSYVDAEVDSAWIGFKIGYAQAMKELSEVEPVAWVNKDMTYVELSTKSTVYGSHIIPLIPRPKGTYHE